MNTGLPVVAIIGRANVGKSSIFNRLVEKRRAIVMEQAGTTRDSVFEVVNTGTKPYMLVDTAGLKTPENDLELSIKEQIEHAAQTADLLLVTVEANIPPTEEDRRVAKLALKSTKPVILVINKFDKAKKQDLSVFEKLGIKQTVSVSSTQGTGIEELESEIEAKVKKAKPPKKSDLTIALLGRPNVGKSSLFNKIQTAAQAIVSDVAGTTRDTNRALLKYEGKTVTLLDTAGIRRSGKSGKGIEYYSAIRTRAAIEEADVCILLSDALEPATKLDQKIAGQVKDAGKGLIVALNKWDLIEKDENTYERFHGYLAHEFQFVNWAQVMAISASEGKNISRLISSSFEIKQQRRRQFKTSELNKWLGETLSHHPPAGLKGKHPKLKYMTQTGQEPPSFDVFGRDTKYLHWSYKRYLEREFRESFDLYGTAINFRYREGKN